MRKFLSAGISDSMFSAVPEEYLLQREVSEVKELASEQNLLSAIGSRALVNTLINRGVNLESGKTFIKMESDDILYVVTVLVGDHIVSLSDYINDNELPEDATIKVAKYSYVKRV